LKAHSIRSRNNMKPKRMLVRIPSLATLVFVGYVVPALAATTTTTTNTSTSAAGGLSGFNVQEQASEPPFASGLLTAFHWFLWMIALVATTGVIVQGAKLLFAVRDGRVGTTEHGQGLALSVGGLVVIAGATAIVGALI
jgi:hypothetical protein